MLDLPRWFDLNRREFERQFGLPAVELKEIVALDASDCCVSSPPCRRLRWTASAWRGYSGMAGQFWLRQLTSSHITGCGGMRSGRRSSSETTPGRTYKVSRNTRSWAQSMSLYGPHWARINAAI